MRDSSTRDLYINLLNSQFANSLMVPRHLDPRHDVFALLQACQDHADGIRELAKIVRNFYRNSRPMHELDELIECMFPDEFLSHDERDEIVRLLADVEPRCLRLACRHASPPSWLLTSLDWTEPETVVRQLESCIYPPGVSPPLLVFVDFVAHQVGAVRSAELHRWIDRIGDRVSLEGSSLRELCVAAVARLDEAQRFYFIVQLRPDGIDPDSYLMCVWSQHYRAAEEPLYRDDTPSTLAEVIEQLSDLIPRAHTVLGVSDGEMVVEFILPRRLISHPVDQWQVDRVFPHRLGTSYPVVVRSLDRLSTQELHGTWRQKWRWLTANGHRDEPEMINWLFEPRTRAPNALYANLRRGQSSVALAMAFPPEDIELGQDELTAALWAGIPVILWCRNPALRGQFESQIRHVLVGHGLMELPAQVLNLRQQADEVEDVPTPLGRHLTLLWDDADRVPASFRSVRLQAPQ